jgi:hypothetical protein
MDTELTADVIRNVGRHASSVAGRPRQNVYDDAPYEVVDTLSAQPDRSIEDADVPAGGPEYSGRA